MAAGEIGHRYALPNSRIMLHQPHGGAQGQATDIAILAKEILYTRERLNKIYAHHTKQPIDKIEKVKILLFILKVMERDCFMSGEEALAFGIVDKVMEFKKPL